MYKYWKIVESYLHIKENPKASFDQFDSYSFPSFLLFANHISNSHTVHS